MTKNDLIDRTANVGSPKSEFSWEVMAQCGHDMSGTIILEDGQQGAKSVGNVCPTCGQSYTVEVLLSKAGHLWGPLLEAEDED